MKLKNNEEDRLKSLSLLGHLEELRKRIIYSLISIILASVAVYLYKDLVFDILAKPVEKLVFLTPAEALLMYMKISLIGGCILASPVVLYNVIAFIAPAFYRHERKYIFIFTPFILFLFFGGIIFGFFISSSSLNFLLGFGSDKLQPMISAGSYFSFILMLMISCGIIFEMPVLAVFLTKLNILSSKTLINKWKYIILGVFIFSALITPSPDAFTQIIVAIPVLFLYLVSIGLVKIFEKNKSS